eukprot:CAMPEP_0168818604 /NCGR_PEP_ID=MMETSP0726-20121227/7842_1 /TAXON_ID=265536 /ORGANISM="Amphiprora sp., Strain CCMP467" /LENGTH=508 /DNA_ID=CAMNT_0008870935 /DNA_START=21 /DNA_END=1547 /DNA_ORIENTATION=+
MTTTTETADTEKRNNDNNVDKKDESSSSVVTTDTFASLGVCEPLQEACQKLGWTYATQIQAQVLPEALLAQKNDTKNDNTTPRDIIGLAETGSGKTGAFCLPILQGLLQQPTKATSAVILTPTRELAFQIHTVVQGLGRGIGATSTCVVGGVDRTAQAIALARTPHILIATPGRLLDHLKDTKGFHLRQVRYLVLDEADRMLSMDFEQELMEILDQIPSERQTLLFSATMTSQVQKLQRASLKSDPVRIEVSTKFQTPKQLQQSYLFLPAKYKDCYLTYLINEHAGKSILVFGATCNNVQRLALMLRNLGFPAVCLHGQMNQAKRLGALQKFSTGARTILLCTDVASRGLDLPRVDLVVNYDLPGHGKEYVHRVGRTARAGQAGSAVAMVTQYDVEVYQRLEVLLGKKLDAYPAAEEETVLVLLERVSEAQRLATRELKEQLSSSGGRHGGGGRRKRRAGDYDDDDGERALQRELRQGYAGGSGGSGGALPNQRGAKGKSMKKHRRRG